MSLFLQLTAIDGAAKPAGGFAPLARWRVPSEAEGFAALERMERAVGVVAASDVMRDGTCFALDLFYDEANQAGECRHPFGLQHATALARNQVNDWLARRPHPDMVDGARLPISSDVPDLLRERDI